MITQDLNFSMTKQGYIKLIRNANKDDKQLNLLADNLYLNDEAKQLLRDNNYGCTGMNIIETIQEILEYIQSLELQIEALEQFFNE